MIYILAGTNRPNSKSRLLADVVKNLYAKLGTDTEILDLAKIPMPTGEGVPYKGPYEESLQTAVNKINRASGLVIICPEYNGSYPGILKLFIDHWSYPESFEARPVCFIGHGGRFGGVRPIEHLQQVFGYRNAYIFPNRVFIFNVWSEMKDSVQPSQATSDLLATQAQDFTRFISALESQGLDANSKKKVSATTTV